MRQTLLFLVGVMLTAAAASAEDGARLSFGASLEADYFGADTYEVAPFGSLGYRRGAFGLEATPRSGRLSWTQSPGLTFGILLRRRSGRDAVEDPAVDALETVPATVEAGLFLRTRAGPMTLSAEIAGDILGETDGIVGELGASLPLPVSDRLTLVPAVGLFGANDAFADAFFSVEAGDVAASGLTRFEAEGGLLGAALGLSARYKLTERIQATGALRYIRLAGDAAESPIVADRGSPDQLVASFGLSVGF